MSRSDSLSGVPTISRFHGIAIRIYPEDHGFPHFHAWAAGRKAKFRINPVEVIEDGLTHKQMRMVKEWAMLHQPELEEDWRRALRGVTLVPIAPWK